MEPKLNRERIAQLIVVLLSALAVKLFYSTASVNELRWILAPTTFLVELATGSRFEFESYAGYVNGDRNFVIAASCAGVNFLITAFLLLSLSNLWGHRSQKETKNSSWRFIPACAVFAFLTTLFANTVRISTALRMHATRFELSWLSREEVHRLEGIVIYFGFLLLLFVVSERLRERSESRLKNFGSLARQSLFPLLIYYATTLGIPLVDAAYRSGPAPADFREHFLFVLLTPLLLILPLIAVRSARALRSRSRSNYSALVINLPKRSNPIFPPVKTPTTFLPRN
jgi:exosortase K